MKTKTLPPLYYRRRYKSWLAKFIFEHEPEGIHESLLFRRLLVKVLNSSQGNHYKL